MDTQHCAPPTPHKQIVIDLDSESKQTMTVHGLSAAASVVVLLTAAFNTIYAASLSKNGLTIAAERIREMASIIAAHADRLDALSDPN